MSLRTLKAKKWVKKQMKKNLSTATPIDCERFIHEADKRSLSALKKIPLLDTVCSKIMSILQDTQRDIINMSGKIHITKQQYGQIYAMVESICKKIGIEMPKLYLELNREPNAYTYGTEKPTLVIHSGLIECLEEDEIYAVLAHECGHIACKHMLYHTIGGLLIDGGELGLDELKGLIRPKGILGMLTDGVVTAIDSTLELAFFQWLRWSELSADRVAVICCGGAKPVVETMMRLAGGTIHLDAEISMEQFAAQATEYQQLLSENKVNKLLEFWLTRRTTHPLLAVRAYEALQFEKTEEFLSL